MIVDQPNMLPANPQILVVKPNKDGTYKLFMMFHNPYNPTETRNITLNNSLSEHVTHLLLYERRVILWKSDKMLPNLSA